MTAADQLIGTARAEIGVREDPLGSNTGPRIRQYQAATDLPGTRWAWCGAFAKWTHVTARVADDGLPHPATAEIARRAYQQGAVVPHPVRGAMLLWPGRHVAIIDTVYSRATVQTIGGNESDSVRRATRSTAGAIVVAPRAIRQAAVTPPAPQRIYGFQDPKGRVLRPGVWRSAAFAANHRRTLGTLGRRARVTKIRGRWRVRMPAEYTYPTKAERDADQARWEALTGRRMRPVSRLVTRTDAAHIIGQGLGRTT